MSLPKLYEDNQPCILSATDYGKRNNHVDVCYHTCCEAAMSGQLELKYCAFTQMMAYIITKPLGLEKLTRLRKLTPSMASKPSSDDN